MFLLTLESCRLNNTYDYANKNETGLALRSIEAHVSEHIFFETVINNYFCHTENIGLSFVVYDDRKVESYMMDQQSAAVVVTIT